MLDFIDSVGGMWSKTIPAWNENANSDIICCIYFRRGTKINDEWKYFPEFQEKYADVPLQFNNFYDVLKRSVELFRDSSSVSRKPERASKKYCDC